MAKMNVFSHRHSHIIIILLSILIGVGAAAIVLYSPSAQQEITPPAIAQGIADLENSFVAVAQNVRPAVVNITAERITKREKFSVPPELRDFFDQFPWPFGERPPSGPEGEDQEEIPFKSHSLGSGWIYSEDGYIVTNTHVVKGGSNFQVQLFDRENDDRKYDAELVGTDPKTDLAVLKVDVGRKLPTLSLGSSAEAKVGQWVMAVGTPFGLDQTVTVGVISAKGRALPGLSKYIRLGDIIQTDAAINRGNSGGPLLNLRGEVIGINVAIVGTGPMGGNVGIGFAIPADHAKRVVPELIEHKVVKRGWLGIGLDDLTENTKDFYGVDHGALVASIHEGSPAAASDLQEEDVIIAVDGQPIQDTWDLQQAIGNSSPGTTIALNVIRNKQEKTVKVTLSEMPAKYAGLEEPKEAKPEKVQQASGALEVAVRGITAADKKKFNNEQLSGVVVADVKRGGPAAQHLLEGDVITKVNRTSIRSLDDWQKAVEEARDSGRSYIVLRITRILEGEVVQTITDFSVNW